MGQIGVRQIGRTPNCPTLRKSIPVTSYTFQERKREEGRKSLQKRWEKREEIFFSPSLNVYDVTGIVFLKVGQFGVRHF